MARVPVPAGTILHRVLAVLAAAVVAGCGGGGGGGGSGNGGSTGFVPAAAPPGAVLHARGTDIRPVRAGAKWAYHSREVVSGFTLDYVTTAAPGSSANQVIETSSDDPASATTVTAEADGSVRMSASVPLGGSAGFTIDGFELRSPVRVNDQVVLYDGNLANIDADGDGRNDVVKLAFWRVVVGNESIALPNRPTLTTAVRVDSFVVVEIVPSSGGGAVRVEAGTSSWYEPGVGLVRLTAAATSPSSLFDSEDLLTGWDGVTEGRGYFTQPQQYVGTTFDPVRNAISAVGLPDGALVLTGNGLHRLDRNGVLQATLPNAPIPTPYQLLRSSTGVQALAGFWPQMQLHALDAQGQYLGLGGAFDFSGGRPNTIAENGPVAQGAHPGNPWLWLAWTRSSMPAPGQVRDEVVLRAIAPNGTSPFPEFAFDAAASPQGLRIAARPGDAVLAWSEQDASGVTRARTVAVSAAGTVAFDTTPLSLPSPFPATLSNVAPLSDGATTWLAWSIGASIATTAPPDARGVTLDAFGQPLGNPAAASLLPAVDAAIVDWPTGVVADGGHLFATGAGFGPVFPGDPQSLSYLSYADHVAGTGPLAGTITRAATYRIPGVGKEYAADPIVFADRVLILSQTGGYLLRPTVIWR